MTAVLPSVSADLPPPAAPATAAALLDVVQPIRRPCPKLLTVTAQPILPGVVVLAVRGEVDLDTGPLLQDSLLAHLRHACPPLVIDLTDVDFFGAAGLTALVTAREGAMASGIRLCVLANSRPVLLPLTITGLDRMFDIHPNLTQALLCLGGGPAE